MADFAAYLQAHQDVDRRFAQSATWTASAIHNIAGMGHFSSDRAIRDYAQTIWNVPL
jgi:starch phosphorylase